MTTEPKHTPMTYIQELTARLQSHIAQMAPHQKERDGGKLLISAARELALTQADNERLREALREMKYIAENLPVLSEFTNLSKANWQKMPCYGDNPDLCGSDACHNCGCIMAKLTEARAALSATERKE